MGTWGFGPFENDDASDWLYGLESSPGMPAIAAALHAVADADDEYVEAPDCANALAAAEIVTALRGRPLVGLPENARAWIVAQDGLDVSPLVPTAQAAVRRIRTNSELKELWNESDDAPKWYAALDDVSERLGA